MTVPRQIDPKLFDFIVCPACRSRLRASDESHLACTGCGTVYPIVDGIPVLIVPPPVIRH